MIHKLTLSKVGWCVIDSLGDCHSTAGGLRKPQLRSMRSIIFTYRKVVAIGGDDNSGLVQGMVVTAASVAQVRQVEKLLRARKM